MKILNFFFSSINSYSLIVCVMQSTYKSTEFLGLIWVFDFFYFFVDFLKL
jgi:hypothetical protein